MFSPPFVLSHGDMTRQHFWVEAYLAALTRLDTEAARVQAERALELCDQRWSKVEKWITENRPADSYPLGYHTDTQPGDYR